jgi:hypothetical protein
MTTLWNFHAPTHFGAGLEIEPVRARGFSRSPGFI